MKLQTDPIYGSVLGEFQRCYYVVGQAAKKCKEDKESIPRTIIYCRRIHDCSELYLFLEKEVDGNSSVLEERLFDIMHSKTPRCLISTKVTGMGMDIQCSNVVHY